MTTRRYTPPEISFDIRPKAPLSFYARFMLAGLILPLWFAVFWWGYAKFWNAWERLRGRAPIFDESDFTEGLDR